MRWKHIRAMNSVELYSSICIPAGFLLSNYFNWFAVHSLQRFSRFCSKIHWGDIPIYWEFKCRPVRHSSMDKINYIYRFHSYLVLYKNRTKYIVLILSRSLFTLWHNMYFDKLNYFHCLTFEIWRTYRLPTYIIICR